MHDGKKNHARRLVSPSDDPLVLATLACANSTCHAPYSKSVAAVGLATASGEVFLGASLESAVHSCVTTLGPRPTLSIGIAHPDAQVQARLDALHLALGRLRAGPG